MTTQITRFLDAALSQVGAPYIWGGKGGKQFRVDPSRGPGLYAHSFGRNVFDCSGLVTWAALEAGGLDQRGELSAKIILERFQPAPNEWESGVLRLYPGHVAIVLCEEIVLEAAGGDSSTLVITPNARVRAGFERRTDFIAARRMQFNR